MSFINQHIANTIIPFFSSDDPNILIVIHCNFQVSKLVPGVSGSQCRAALEAVNWDTSIAVKNLKIDKLYRIGVAEKTTCEKVLKSVEWDLEQAAALLLDQ